MPEYTQVAPLIKVICSVLADGRIEDEGTIVDCFWAISYHCRPREGQAECLIETKLYEKIILVLISQTNTRDIAPFAMIVETLCDDDDLVELLISVRLFDAI